ncbi:hypothetical protein ACHAW5_002949 [Stephanodiscus triporus]|uniref:Uncharacterized protein n=1 Tax=Stephanodiscus triporus TaxID=2934178 RepID=A0ABD3NV72_9STRA
MTRSTVAAAMLRKKGAMEKNTAKEDGESPVKWQKSDGKKFLRKGLWNLHSSDPHFSEYPLKNFTTNFKNLKKKVLNLMNRLFHSTRSLILDHLHTKQGYPHWNRHPAKEHLEDDVYKRIADTMVPSELRMMQTSYQDFPQDIFYVRVHAKKRKQMEQTFWIAKRNKTALQRHLKEAAEFRKNRAGIKS